MGRKKIHDSNADRSAAYRVRKASAVQAMIDDLQLQLLAASQRSHDHDVAFGALQAENARLNAALQAQPATTDEALQVELQQLRQKLEDAERKVRGLEFDVHELQRTKPGKLPRRAAAKHRMAVLRAAFIRSYSAAPEEAKRFRTNTTKAATAAGEIATLLRNAEFELQQHLAGDIELLQIAAAIMNAYAGDFEKAQHEAAGDNARRQRESEAREKREIATYAERRFGTTPDLAEVRKTAEDMIAFLKLGEVWLLERKRSRGIVRVNVNFGLSNMSAFRLADALRQHPADARKIALVVAAELKDSDQRGKERISRFNSDIGELVWDAGVDDFEAWRASAQSTVAIN